MRISINCPTRGRPENMLRLCESVFNTANKPELVEVCFYIDEDDTLSQFATADIASSYSNVNWVIGPRIVLSHTHNEIWNICCGELCHFCGDDIVFRTKGWDSILWESYMGYPDQIWMGYGDDGYWHEALSTHPCISRKWIEVVGHVASDKLTADWADNWIFDVSKGIDRCHYLPYETEHMHVSFGKAEMDETYTDNFRRAKIDNPTAIYQQLLPERLEDVKKLLQFIQENTNASTNPYIG